MKTRYIPWMWAILLLGACQEKEFFQSEDGIRVLAGFADTRTTYTEEGNMMRVDWAAEDEIGLCTAEQMNLSYRAENAGETTAFYCDGEEALAAEEGDSVFAYYPRREADGTSIAFPSLARQYHTTDMADMDYMYASGVVNDQVLSLQFKHMFAFLKITLPTELMEGITNGGLLLQSTEPCAANLRYDIQTQQFTSEYQWESVWYVIPDTALASSEEITCTIALLPQSGNATLTLTSCQDSEDGDIKHKSKLLTRKAPEGGFQAGHVYTVDLTGTEAEDIQKTEREALIAFYNATDGEHWKDNTNWCSDKPLDEWHGVSIGFNGLVNSLNLTSNSLKGEIPAEIGKLSSLAYLELAGNQLTGNIPAEIGQLTDLNTLSLGANQLSGPLPKELGNCRLGYIYLTDNRLSGEISDVFNTPYLRRLYLTNNQFTGSLPELGENVEYFLAENNQFSGSIPDSHTRVLQKEYAYYKVSFNNLTGDLPPAIANHKDFHIYWFDILRQNAGYGFNRVALPAHSHTVQCYDGSSLNLGEEYAKNECTLLFRWDPYCPFSAGYPEQLEQLRKKYQEKGLGIINMTIDKYSTGEIAPLTAAMPETPVFWETTTQGETVGNNPYNWYMYYLFYFPVTPYFYIVDKSGNIIFFGSGEVYNGTIPQYHENRDELFDFIANLFGDEGFEPEETEYYTSTDYSRDGEVVTLQEASVGSGIDLVFMGEGFVDKDMGDGGLYEQKMAEGMEQFFAYEPYTGLRDRFNVYAVKVVSPNAEFASGAEHRINESLDICTEYAQKIPGFEIPRVSVIYNTEYAGRSFTTMISDGSFFAFMMEGVNDVLNHEAGGHGLANLSDEYVEGGYENLTLPEEEKEKMDFFWTSYGWGANVDWRNDPATVRWAHFLQDNRYAGEGLGLYEGANLYGHGAYRPTDNSMMRYNDCPFNAPSREQIYKRVMQLSEGATWTYDYEEFVQFDAPSRNAATTRSLRQAPSAAQVEKWRKSHRPPVRVKGTWRDALKDNIVVPYR